MKMKFLAFILSVACFGAVAEQVWAFAQQPVGNNTTVGLGIHQPPPGQDLDNRFTSWMDFPAPGMERVHFHVNVCCVACPTCTVCPEKCCVSFSVTIQCTDGGNPSVSGPVVAAGNGDSCSTDCGVCAPCKEIPIAHNVTPGSNGYPAGYTRPTSSISCSVNTTCKCCDGTNASTLTDRDFTLIRNP